jgi:hypothetical protein
VTRVDPAPSEGAQEFLRFQQEAEIRANRLRFSAKPNSAFAESAMSGTSGCGFVDPAQPCALPSVIVSVSGLRFKYV